MLSGDEMETILRMRYDNTVGFSPIRKFNPLFTINSHSEWKYNYDSIDNDWYLSDLTTSSSNWIEKSIDDLPNTSTNHIQLYRKTFDLMGSINDISGFVISIKYKYGCIIYMNGNEVFRNGISDGTISESSISSNTYNEVIYRQISLPIKAILGDETDPKAIFYVKSGSNTIAIGLVGSETTQNEVEFDCALRLMSKEAESRIIEYQVDYDGIDIIKGDLLSYYYTDAFESANCEN